VGDAVVELVTRTWLFHVFPFLSVHSLSSLKDVVVCNESLAFTCYVHRIHTHADFNDSLLTSQITKYADLVEYKNFDNPLFLEGDKGEKEKEEGEEGEEEDSEGRKENEIKKGRGLYLWSTNPPKVLNDLTESLIGAIHVDAGLNFEISGKYTQMILRPILKFLWLSLSPLPLPLTPSEQPIMLSLTSCAVVQPVQSTHELYSTADSFKLESKLGELEIHKARVVVNGIVVGAYNHPSRTVARHMACALSIKFAKSFPELFERLLVVKGGKKEDEEEGEEGDEDQLKEVMEEIEDMIEEEEEEEGV